MNGGQGWVRYDENGEQVGHNGGGGLGSKGHQTRGTDVGDTYGSTYDGGYPRESGDEESEYQTAEESHNESQDECQQPSEEGDTASQNAGPYTPRDQNPQDSASAEQGTSTPRPQRTINFEVMTSLPSASPLPREALPSTPAKENVKAKRPRGRPRKSPKPDDTRKSEENQAVELQTMTKGAEGQEEEGPSTPKKNIPKKRGRGRPRKSEVAAEALEEVLHETEAGAKRKAVEQSAVAAVVERKKRGRPPKKRRDGQGQVVTS